MQQPILNSLSTEGYLVEGLNSRCCIRMDCVSWRNFRNGAVERTVQNFGHWESAAAYSTQKERRQAQVGCLCFLKSTVRNAPHGDSVNRSLGSTYWRFALIFGVHGGESDLCVEWLIGVRPACFDANPVRLTNGNLQPQIFPANTFTIHFRHAGQRW
jgi:hypothetical protein